MINNEYIDLEPSNWITKSYGELNCNLEPSDLTDVYVVHYKFAIKGCDNEFDEKFVFFDKIDKALTLFKVIPHSKATLKRILTDDDTIICLSKIKREPQDYDVFMRSFMETNYETKDVIVKKDFEELEEGVVETKLDDTNHLMV